SSALTLTDMALGAASDDESNQSLRGRRTLRSPVSRSEAGGAARPNGRLYRLLIPARHRRTRLHGCPPRGRWLFSLWLACTRIPENPISLSFPPEVAVARAWSGRISMDAGEAQEISPLRSQARSGRNDNTYLWR